MTITGTLQDSVDRIKKEKEHSVTLTGKSGHLAWCPVVLALARQNGDALSPAPENLYHPLAGGRAKTAFSRDVNDIEWLRNRDASWASARSWPAS
jgi:hypothetical protein